MLLEHAEKDHQRALHSLGGAQQRVEHARNALTAKTGQRDVAVQKKADTEVELQVAKYFAEYFASAWERKENELAKTTAELHRAEVGGLRCVDCFCRRRAEGRRRWGWGWGWTPPQPGGAGLGD